MAKYYGKIGFAIESETSPGVWVASITERPYFGEMYNLSVRQTGGQKINDDLTINMRLSVLMDPFMMNNHSMIKYAEYKGTKWKVESISSIEYPRIYLNLGGVYHGSN